eukprot:1839993-Karenia_brevis.AAC.1
MPHSVSCKDTERLFHRAGNVGRCLTNNFSFQPLASVAAPIQPSHFDADMTMLCRLMSATGPLGPSGMFIIPTDWLLGAEVD